MFLLKLILLTVAGLVCMAPVHTEAAIIHVSNAELLNLSQKGVTIIDIRTRQEWQETGVIPGSRLLTLFDERRHIINKNEWLKQVRALAPANQPVVLVCRTGNRTLTAAHFLDKAGYTTVYNATGGIKSWVTSGLPITRHLTQ